MDLDILLLLVFLAAGPPDLFLKELMCGWGARPLLLAAGKSFI